jgi:hypothetical protein
VNDTLLQRPSRLIRLGDALSQFFNVLIFNGDANYSISGDAHRFKRLGLERFIDLLFSSFETNHCERAYWADVARAYSIVEESQQ